MMKTDGIVQNRLRGMLYGMAIGDALGAAVEFKQKGQFEPVTGYRGFGPHGLAPGQWTDDTSMALALADSINIAKWSKKDQLSRYLQWRKHGKYSVTGYLFDIGNTTRSAIDFFEGSGSLTNNASDQCSGNGSIMRLAPVVAAYFDKEKFLYFQRLSESSETTHASRLCKSSCVYMGFLLKGIIDGEDKEEVLSRGWWDRQGVQLVPEVLDIIENDEKEPVGSGFVIDSLHAALWAFRTSSSFEEAILKAVNLGNDSDTTGAVCGHFAGAYWGFDQIPQHLIDGLDRKNMLDEYFDPLLDRFQQI